ncbi:hypothetical protein TNCT_139221 [Trichonephila clavata]|uniref:Uncharacterized protein n=1 Tax=Trichonephila clavata TaxID=2740835 RepID=A0A8X6LW79_TRICU|nr:hypothetical protein TNCT_139221 [Trichonephila clavata]
MSPPKKPAVKSNTKLTINDHPNEHKVHILGGCWVFLVDNEKRCIHAGQQLMEERLIRIDLLGVVKANLSQSNSPCFGLSGTDWDSFNAKRAYRT